MDARAAGAQIKQAVAKQYRDKFDESLSEVRYGVGTGSLCLDLAIGRPGLPAGRLTTLEGLEGTGKSLLAYSAMSECQRKGGIVVLFETEEGIERSRLQKLGVRLDDSLLGPWSPGSVENFFEMTQTTVSGLRQEFQGPLVVVLDSVGASCTSEEEDRDYTEREVGGHARAFKRGLQKLLPVIARHQVVLIFVNQLYATLNQYGDAYESYGGKAIKYRATLRIMLRTKKSAIEYEQDEAKAVRNMAEVIKNKISSPWRETEFRVSYVDGIDKFDDLLRACQRLGLVKRSGGWFAGFGQKFQKNQWKDVLLAKCQTVGRAYDLLTKAAVEKGLLKAYDGKPS